MTGQRPRTESELVEFVRSIDEPAPASLHRQVGAMIAARPARGMRDLGRTRAEGRSSGRERASGARRRAGARAFGIGPRLAATGAIAAAIVALALAIGLSSGSSTLSVRDASALTLRAATGRAPAESSSHHTELAANVDGVSFPYWGERFGWHSSGTRTDRVDGRSITTVFYVNGRGKRIGYAIVADSAQTQMSGGIVSRRDGTPYRLLTVDGAPVVTWLRDGHLCVVSGRGVSGATLLRLASWDDRHSEAS
jgi:hypothetical protein